jgi:hypothetical protein
MRDAPMLRAELRPSPSRADLLRAMTDVLLKGWPLRGRQRDVLRAVIAHATSVGTWHSLVVQQHLTSEEAVELLVDLVVGTAHPREGHAG